MRHSMVVCYVVASALLVGCGDTSGSSDGNPAASCPALDSCHDAGTYDTHTQQCTHPSKPDGTPCAAATACEGDRVCRSGICAAGDPVVCPGSVGCNLAVCDPNAGCDVVTLTGPCSPGLTPVPLAGCTSGDYVANITLGTSQQFAMIVDSGSSSIAVAGAGCTNCSAISPTYTPGSTATNEHYTASGAYGAASGWRGTVYNDLMTLTGDANSTLSINFVSIGEQSVDANDKHTTAFFTTSYCSGSAVTNSFQGIFGLGGESLNAAHTTNYLDALKGTHSAADAFTVQFCDAGGNLWFGGYNPNALSAAPQYTPMDISSGYYRVYLEDILFGDASLGLAPSVYGHAVVDTGTSVVVVNDTIMQAVNSVADSSTAFRSFFKAGFLGGNSCVAPADRPSKAQLDAALPPMTWVFKRADGSTFNVAMPATESYLTPQLLASDVLGYCSGFINGGTATSETIIGNSAMHSQVVIFDRAGGQLGFAPQRGCP